MKKCKGVTSQPQHMILFHLIQAGLDNPSLTLTDLLDTGDFTSKGSLHNALVVLQGRGYIEHYVKAPGGRLNTTYGTSVPYVITCAGCDEYDLYSSKLQDGLLV